MLLNVALKIFEVAPVMKLVPRKIFKAKYRIPPLLDYTGVAPDSWWEHWPSLSWEKGRQIKSSINPVKLTKWAKRADYMDMGTLMDIVKDVRNGCDLGTRGVYLCPSVSTNAPSAYEYADRVTDTIVDGIHNGIMIGPWKKGDIPFDTVKINGLMVKLKDNGGARIILNMSRGEPFCVNEGMEIEGRFEVSMSSTRMWLRSLHSAGKGCYMCKLDWRGAFKQLRTQVEDVRQQVFEWQGRYFAELCLIFGARSSVGLYDMLAKVFKHIATRLSNMPGNQV